MKQRHFMLFALSNVLTASCINNRNGHAFNEADPEQLASEPFDEVILGSSIVKEYTFVGQLFKNDLKKGGLMAFHLRRAKTAEGSSEKALRVFIDSPAEGMKEGMFAKITFSANGADKQAIATKVEMVEPQFFLRVNAPTARENGSIGIVMVVPGLKPFASILFFELCRRGENLVSPQNIGGLIEMSVDEKIQKAKSQMKINLSMWKQAIMEMSVLAYQYVYENTLLAETVLAKALERTNADELAIALPEGLNSRKSMQRWLASQGVDAKGVQTHILGTLEDDFVTEALLFPQVDPFNIIGFQTEGDVHELVDKVFADNHIVGKLPNGNYLIKTPKETTVTSETARTFMDNATEDVAEVIAESQEIAQVATPVLTANYDGSSEE